MSETIYTKEEDYQYLRGYLRGLQDFERTNSKMEENYYAGYEDGLVDRYLMEEDELIKTIGKLRRQLMYYP